MMIPRLKLPPKEIRRMDVMHDCCIWGSTALRRDQFLQLDVTPLPKVSGWFSSLLQGRSMGRSRMFMVVTGADSEERGIHNLTGKDQHARCATRCSQFMIVRRTRYFRKRSIGTMGLSNEECTALCADTAAITKLHVQS
jgi:hypothetical protein